MSLVKAGRRTGRAALFVAFLLSWVVSAEAQSGNEGSIEGTVTDPSGALVPGVTLRVREVNTSATHSATTDDRGFFRFLVLPVGTYELVAQREGFAMLIHKDVVVTVGARIDLPLTLRLVTQAQSVVVGSAVPLVETTRTQVSSTVEERSIANLPVNGRNYIDFIVLAPGVVRDPVSGTQSFGGQRSLALMLVDGLNDTNPGGGETFLNLPYQFSIEVVREFQVNTNGYSAELGRAANGIVSTITKSGTNEFHGALFWYFRDQGLNATDLIRKTAGQPKEPLHVHQFGGAGGGPILKNRLFFFVGYDGQRRQLQNLAFLSLPSRFAVSSDPAIAAFQQRALDYLTPRAASYLQTFNEDPYFVKIDWHIADSQRLSARWNSVRFQNTNGRNSGPQNSLEHTGDAPTHNESFTVSLTSTVSSGSVNVTRFNYLYNEFRGGSNSVNPQANIFEGGQRVLLIGRAVSDPTRNYFHQFEWLDTLSLTRARHTLKLGAEGLLSRSTLSATQSFSGNYRFNSLESFGRSLAQLPVCNPAPPPCRTPLPGETYTQAFSGESKPGASVHPNSMEFAGFVQDEWRARRNLTFSLGLRYDLQWMARPRVKNPSPSLAPAGLDTSFVPLDANNFAPRFGFAWGPLHNQRLVVRGGYGFFYGWLRGGMAARAHFQNGISVQTRTFTGASIPAYPNTLCGPPDPSGLPPACPSPVAGVDTIMPFSPDYVQPYDQHANFGIEFQLQNNWAISASYLMVRGTHLQRWRDVNLLAPIPAVIGIAGTNTRLTYQRFPGPAGLPARPIPGFDRVLALESSGNSTYHGLILQLNKRLSRDFQLLAAYTLSKVIDDRPEPLVFNPGSGLEALLLSDPSNPRADRGVGALDARHRFVLSGIWDLNYANRLPRPARVVLNGWEFGAILAVQSGLPYSGLVNLDLNNDGNPFSDRTPGQPRDTFRLPTTVSLDPRLTRNVAIRGRLRLQFIWEAFNVFNRANITDVRATQYARSSSATVCGIAGTPCLLPQTTGTTAFGTPFATSGPRIMQLALKLLF